MKVSDDELIFITGHSDIEKVRKSLLRKFELSLLAVTLDLKDVLLCKQHQSRVNLQCKDCGYNRCWNSFWGAMLCSLISNNKEVTEYSAEEFVD